MYNSIPDEPVRGRTPPPWYFALDGIERARAFSRGQLPWPPLARLLGTRTTHVAAGTATVAMPASDACRGANGQLQISPLLIAALERTADTAVAAGFRTYALRFSQDQFRPILARPGNLIARGRVVNGSHLYLFTEVQVYDPDGRHVCQGALHSAIERVDPPPPSPPEKMNPVTEPVYETPDPYLRENGSRMLSDRMESESGLSLLRESWGEHSDDPLKSIYGLELNGIDHGRVSLTMPASEWFCSVTHDVAAEAIATLADITYANTMISMHQPGKTMVPFEIVVRFLRPVRADGRLLRPDGVSRQLAPERFAIDVSIQDEDGNLVATSSGSCARIDNALRSRRRRIESKRVLATLFFADVVDSTKLAEQLGDAAWQALLEKYKLAVRRDVSRHNGTEVDTAGDGFFARFDSPAQSIEAARAVRGAAAGLGIQIRVGIHAGECELVGNNLTGMAVHIAARIQGIAERDEILVSSTVKDLAIGSQIQFESRGDKELKGVPDLWRVFAVKN